MKSAEAGTNAHPRARSGSLARPVGRTLAAAWIREHGDPVAFHGTQAGVPAVDGPVAVISDVHANLPALVAVLADIEARGIDRIWCLGDTVGYGAEPVQCLRLVRERCELVLVGNHDLAVVGDEPIAKFGMHARPGVSLARRQLEVAPDGVELHDWLATRLTEVVDARRSAGYSLMHKSHLDHHRIDELAPSRIVAAHGCPSPYDTVWDYLNIDVDPLELAIALDIPPLILVGHSHAQQFDGIVCNPGSVGQPRDGDPRAAWAEISSTDIEPDHFIDVHLHRVEYDVERAQQAMRAAGLPAMTIQRIAAGD